MECDYICFTFRQFIVCVDEIHSNAVSTKRAHNVNVWRPIESQDVVIMLRYICGLIIEPM